VVQANGEQAHAVVLGGVQAALGRLRVRAAEIFGDAPGEHKQAGFVADRNWLLGNGKLPAVAGRALSAGVN
jgi:hypothetical protein